MKRIVMSLLLLGLVFLMAGTVFAEGGSSDSSATIRITISPAQGEPGTQIAISGTGADPDLEVYVSLASQSDPGKGELTSVVVGPNSNGSFKATLTVPGGISDALYFVRAEQLSPGGDVQQYYWKGFNVGTGGEGSVKSGGGVGEGAAGNEESLMPETGAAPGISLTITAALALLLVVGMAARGLYTVVARKA